MLDYVLASQQSPQYFEPCAVLDRAKTATMSWLWSYADLNLSSSVSVFFLFFLFYFEANLFCYLLSTTGFFWLFLRATFLTFHCYYCSC